MKVDIHPKKNNVVVRCSCSNVFNLDLAVDFKNMVIEVCNKCHPFYTGQQKIIDVSGRVESFNKKFNKLKN